MFLEKKFSQNLVFAKVLPQQQVPITLLFSRPKKFLLSFQIFFLRISTFQNKNEALTTYLAMSEVFKSKTRIPIGQYLDALQFESLRRFGHLTRKMGFGDSVVGVNSVGV